MCTCWEGGQTLGVQESVQVSVGRCVQGEEMGNRGARVSVKSPRDRAFEQRPECRE